MRSPGNSVSGLAARWAVGVSLSLGLSSPSVSAAATLVLDPVFQIFPGGEFTSVGAVAVQADGRILAGGLFALANGSPRFGLARFHPDGSLDEGFTPRLRGDNWFGGRPVIQQIAVLPDGKLLLAGLVRMSGEAMPRLLVRLNPDGSWDRSFAAQLGERGPVWAPPVLRHLIVRPDGKLLAVRPIVSNFEPSRDEPVRLHADGSVDSTFNAGNAIAGYVTAMAAQGDGKVLVAWERFAVDGTHSRGLVRLRPDGSLDSGFQVTYSGPDNDTAIRVMVEQADGKLLLGGAFRRVQGTEQSWLGRLNSDGSMDASFTPTLAASSGGSAAVHALSLHADGRILVGGSFELVNGQTRWRVARLLPDGTLDAGFRPLDPSGTGEALNGQPTALAVSSDDRIVAVGFFNTPLPGNPCGIARLRANGRLDDSFRASLRPSAAVTALAVAPDGTVFVAGDFLEMNGRESPSVARLNVDGVFQGTPFAWPFLPRPQTGSFGEPNFADVAFLANGRFGLGGAFEWHFNGLALRGLAVFGADGQPDTAFRPQLAGLVRAVGAQQSSELIVAGEFAGRSLVRLNRNGNADETFAPHFDNSIRGLAVQADDRIVAVGAFTTVNGAARAGVARLDADGTLDATFTPPVADGSSYGSVAVMPTGQVILAEDARFPFGSTEIRLRRLHADGTHRDHLIVPMDYPVSDVIVPAIQALAADRDGSLLLSGYFNFIGEELRLGVARFQIQDQPDLQLSALGFGADGRWRMRISGQAGWLVRIEASPDLRAWSVVGEVVLQDAPAEFAHAAEGLGHQFYRALAGPD